MNRETIGSARMEAKDGVQFTKEIRAGLRALADRA
jgi:hypothetical protein